MVYVFNNKQLVSSVRFPNSYRNSVNKLFVGNNGSLRYFSGIINEINISSGAKSSQDISTTWDKINHWLQNNSK